MLGFFLPTSTRKSSTLHLSAQNRNIKIILLVDCNEQKAPTLRELQRLQQCEKRQLAQVSIGNTESQKCSSSGPDQQPIPLTPFCYPECSLLLFLSVPNFVM